ncbi:MAG: ribonuclease HI family protein [Oligoflexus sp.]|nr:ribonuclease HI family protein [Oligoflexus sp.]
MDSIWTVYFDGSSFGKGRRGGPGPSAGAAVLVSAQGVAYTNSLYLPRSDSDTAEYCGLICGLKAALDAGAQSIVIRGDSRNVIDQISGRKVIRKKELLSLGTDAHLLLDRFRNWSIEWIPRARNNLADAAARACIDQARSPSNNSMF